MMDEARKEGGRTLGHSEAKVKDQPKDFLRLSGLTLPLLLSDVTESLSSFTSKINHL